MDKWHLKEYLKAWEAVICIPIGWVVYLLLKLFEKAK
jgi:hypothetical protein